MQSVSNLDGIRLSQVECGGVQWIQVEPGVLQWSRMESCGVCCCLVEMD